MGPGIFWVVFIFFVFYCFKLKVYQTLSVYIIRYYDVKFGDFVEGAVTYFTMCVAAHHEKSDSYHDVVKSNHPNLLRNMGKRDSH